MDYFTQPSSDRVTICIARILRYNDADVTLMNLIRTCILREMTSMKWNGTQYTIIKGRLRVGGARRLCELGIYPLLPALSGVVAKDLTSSLVRPNKADKFSDIFSS